jgi:mannosylglycerate hydrolase
VTDVVVDTGPTVVHLVSHTYWDREWYEPFQTFRMRLVELIDQLLGRMEADPRLRFTLDGQAATVDDYLEVRPDAEPLIRRLMRLPLTQWEIATIQLQALASSGQLAAG